MWKSIMIVPLKDVTERKWEDDFPRELFIEIFSYLPSKDLASVALVCKLFFRLAKDPAVKTLNNLRESAKTLISRTTNRYSSKNLFFCSQYISIRNSFLWWWVRVITRNWLISCVKCWQKNSFLIQAHNSLPHCHQQKDFLFFKQIKQHKQQFKQANWKSLRKQKNWKILNNHPPHSMRFQQGNFYFERFSAW